MILRKPYAFFIKHFKLFHLILGSLVIYSIISWFSPGINIIIGENGTGKTHLIKAIYSACSLVNGLGPGYWN